MRSFDAFGRPVQEFQVKTNTGGYLSVCSLCIILTLFFTELRYFLQLETRDEMLIDQNQDQKYLNIGLNITLSAAPCAAVTVNLLDTKRANVMHVVHEIYKTRLSSSGKQLGRKVRDSLGNVVQTSTELAVAGNHTARVKTTHATAHLRCPSCFQSHIDEDDCCASCDDVRQEFRSRSLNDDPAEYVFGQCMDTVYAEAGPEEREGCRLEARLHVRKVPATIHIGIGKHFRSEFVRALDLKESLASMDFSHRVDGLSFGPDFPGLVHVLDGREKSFHKPPESEHYQYDLHVIPTRYNDDGLADEVTSHQYSVTEYVKQLDQRSKQGDSAALGLWLNYDFTPFEVKVTRSRKSLWHFLTECCAILGGIFAFTGMLDNFAYQMNRAVGSGRVELAY